MAKIKFQNQKGALVVEALVATFIVTLILIISASAAAAGLSASRRALDKTQAAYLLEEGAEIVKIIRDEDWAGVSGLLENTDYYASFSGGIWALSTTPSTIDGFTRIFEVEEVVRDANDDIDSSGTADDGTRLITVTVSWAISSGTTASETLSFYVSDILSSS